MHATVEHKQDIDQVRQAKLDVKSEVARQLIEAMEAGNTPWQRPWKSQSLMPINGATQNGYRGINRILLGLQNRSSNIWLTFNQAKDAGYMVRKGEKGTPIVKVVELDRGERDGSEGASSSMDGRGDGKEARKAFILRRYFVFNAEQIEGFPIPVEEPGPLAHESVEQAAGVVEAMKEQTGLMVIHGGNNACYVPSLHEVRLPPKKAFDGPFGTYNYWVTALHECSHASMHERCLNRTDAIAKKWGDEAYAMEELRAEIASCLLAHSTGLARGQGASDGGPADPYAHHREQHAAYLRGWVKVIKNDPMAIFSAAKDADRICEYMLGFAMKREAMAPHREWVAEYERS